MTDDARPWLARYRAGTRRSIPLGGEGGFESALAMFRATVAAHPDRAAHPLRRHDADGRRRRPGQRRAGRRAGRRRVRHGRPASPSYLQNVPQYVIAVLAAWKAGGIVVPINPMNKERELTYALEDSGAIVLITLESLYHDVVPQGRRRPGVRTVITTSELDFVDRRDAAQRARRRRSATARRTPPTCSSSSRAHDGEQPPAGRRSGWTTSPSSPTRRAPPASAEGGDEHARQRRVQLRGLPARGWT